MDALKFINYEKNFPRHPNWQTSFYAELTETGIWNANKFWELHLDIISITISLSGVDFVKRDFATDLTWLAQRISELISSHFDDNDVFVIENIQNDELRLFKERFDLAVIGVFSGNLLPEEDFELMNPLIEQSGANPTD